MMLYRRITVGGIGIFYREAGSPKLPTLLLLHGFPSASHMFRGLMPLLSDMFHVVAFDYPGFGQSDAPDREHFAYTFDNLADVAIQVVRRLGLNPCYLYVFDYGAPIGLRMAMRHPDWILGIISQNGNMYREGLGPKWEQRRKFWDNPTPEGRRLMSAAFAPETIIRQYEFGAPPHSISPDGYTLDIAYTHTPGYAQRQLDLIFDYRMNERLYPRFQAYLRRYQPPLLAVWGRNDPSFIPAGAIAFKRDDPHATVMFVPSGHFALESHARVIATSIRDWFTRAASGEGGGRSGMSAEGRADTEDCSLRDVAEVQIDIPEQHQNHERGNCHAIDEN